MNTHEYIYVYSNLYFRSFPAGDGKGHFAPIPFGEEPQLPPSFNTQTSTTEVFDRVAN